MQTLEHLLLQDMVLEVSSDVEHDGEEEVLSMTICALTPGLLDACLIR